MQVNIRVIDITNCEFNETSVEIDDPMDNSVVLKDVIATNFDDLSGFEVFYRNRRLCR